LLFYPDADSQVCTVKREHETEAERPVVKQYPGPKHCGRFRPSLKCRAVRAAEESNDLKRREIEAMEGLLEIARRGFPALLIRQDGSYVDGND
jgi:negative regulator of sigma E activity